MSDEKQTAFLEEKPGNKSAMRLLCVQSWWAAFVMATMLPWIASKMGPQALDYYFMLAAGFLLSAFGGKVGQKWLETKPPKV
jgi:hypothetical protein